MKTLKSIAAFASTSVVATRVAAILVAMGLYMSSAQAQSTQLPGEKMASSSDLANRTKQPAQSGTKSVRQSAVDPVLNTQVTELTLAADQALSHISFETLAATDSRAEAKATIRTDVANSLVDDHNVNVKVGFEARPIGGILTVQVSMSPSFRGIGVSTRPVVSRSVAQAVDAMDEAIVRQMVAELTKEIYDEFAAHDDVR